MTRYDEQLKSELKGRAADVGGHPILFEDVKRDAASIRKRRRVVAGTAVAAVLAVTIPVGVAASNAINNSKGSTGPVDEPTAPPTVSTTDGTAPTPSPDTTPPPDPTTPVEETQHVVLTTDVQARGDGVVVPFLLDGVINLWDVPPVTVGAGYQSFVYNFQDQSWLMGSYDADGNGQLQALDGEGSPTGPPVPFNGTFAVSWDGTLVSYATPDGSLMVLRDQNPSPLELRPEVSGTISPVAIAGSDGNCVDPEVSTAGSCVVYFNVDGRRPTSYLADPHGIVEELPFERVADVAENGWIAGRISATDYGSCSAVLDSHRQEQWRTCDYTLGRFSPDGRYILGRPAYLDGIGDGSVAILDAETGHVLSDYRPAQGEFVFINSTVWNSDSTAATTVWDIDHWSVMQIDAEGGLKALIPRVAGANAAEDTPVFFATRP